MRRRRWRRSRWGRGLGCWPPRGPEGRLIAASVLLPVRGTSATASAGTLSRDTLRKASSRVDSDCVLPWTAELEHVPVKDVIVGEALLVEQVAEELPEVAGIEGGNDP